MAYNQTLANRIRELLQDLERIEEKEMFGGLCFLLKDKMFVGVIKEEMMCRIGPALFEDAIEKTRVSRNGFHRKTIKRLGNDRRFRSQNR